MGFSIGGFFKGALQVVETPGRLLETAAKETQKAIDHGLEDVFENPIVKKIPVVGVLSHITGKALEGATGAFTSVGALAGSVLDGNFEKGAADFIAHPISSTERMANGLVQGFKADPLGFTAKLAGGAVATLGVGAALSGGAEVAEMAASAESAGATAAETGATAAETGATAAKTGATAAEDVGQASSLAGRETELADQLHQDWQQTALDSGRTERFKPFKPAEGEAPKFADKDAMNAFLDERKVPPELRGHYKLDDAGALQEDILNIPNRYLSHANAAENNASAEVVMNAIGKQLAGGGKLDAAWVEKASDEVHVEWLARREANGDMGWVPKEQTVPFKDLSVEEANKDRAMVELGRKLVQGDA